MRPIRTTLATLRLALAMLFAVVTVFQVPAMAVGCMIGAPAHPSMAAPQDHHSSPAGHHASHGTLHADHNAHGSAPAPDTAHPSVCGAIACCAAVSPAAVPVPIVMDRLLGRLDLSPARVMLSSIPEPADPPPRPQV